MADNTDNDLNNDLNNENNEDLDNLTGYKKAAILLVILGKDISSKIFKYLKDDEIENISLEISKINFVTPQQQEHVLNEFKDLVKAKNYINQGGFSYAKDLLKSSLGTKRALSIIDKLTASTKSRPFDILRRTDHTYLLNFLHNEHPQTIALILSYLEPKKASSILSSLPPNIQSTVASRIATMDRTSPDILKEVDQVLEKKLSALSNEDFTHVGGLQTIVEILNLADRSTEKNIMEYLDQHDSELAENIKNLMFVFEDIVLVDDKSMQLILREINTNQLAQALKTVDSEVQDKVFRNMSKRAAQALQEDMQYMGPIRRTDVENSQQAIVAIIRKMEENGTIMIARPGQDDDIV